MGFACFVLAGCSMSAALEPIHFETVSNQRADAEAQNNKQVMVHQSDNYYSVGQVESSRTDASEKYHGPYQNLLGKEELSRESILDNETSVKRNRVIKANGEESCRLLYEGVDSSNYE